MLKAMRSVAQRLDDTPPPTPVDVLSRLCVTSNSFLQQFMQKYSSWALGKA
jgi:hypothetical protein